MNMATPNTHFGAENIALMLKDCKSIYFIGIGGINMSSLAHISHLRGLISVSATGFLFLQMLPEF
jgi:hypothetical protein